MKSKKGESFSGRNLSNKEGEKGNRNRPALAQAAADQLDTLAAFPLALTEPAHRVISTAAAAFAAFTAPAAR